MTRRLRAPEMGLPDEAVIDVSMARPRGPATRFLLAMAARIETGSLLIETVDGTTVMVGHRDAAPRAVVRLNRPSALVLKLFSRGPVGFAEAYIDGDWDSPDLTAFLELCALNESVLGDRAAGLAPFRALNRLRHQARANTRRGSRRNISQHYDLGNAFYSRWLDPGMTYSSALFDGRATDLDSAQANKDRRMADILNLRPGLSVLEIGCGWGGFAVRMAGEYGCSVTAVTLSREQYEYTRARVFEAGLAETVDVRLQDYRDLTGSFDRVASVEMFEAVGEENWPLYFQVLRDRLKPSGIAALQVITIAERRFDAYRSGANFIQRYVFPGGMLPTDAALRREVARARLALRDAFHFGRSYGRTLALWQDRFQAAWPAIEADGFDRRFKRMWEFYLAYCEAGFRVGTIDVGQYRIVRP